MLTPELLGPYALLAALLITVGALWRDHQRSDAREQARQDKAIGIVEGLVPTVKQLADAQLEGNKLLSEIAANNRKEP